MKSYEVPELTRIGQLTVTTLSSTASAGAPGQGDDNSPGDVPGDGPSSQANG